MTTQTDSDTNKDAMLEAWYAIHGEANSETEAQALAQAKANYIGEFDCPDCFVQHEIERFNWFKDTPNIIAGNVDLESMALALEYKSDDYHGSDNHNGHYFVLQDSTTPDTSSAVVFSADDTAILNAWVDINGLPEKDDKTTLAIAKNNLLGRFDSHEAFYDYCAAENKCESAFESSNNYYFIPQ